MLEVTCKLETKSSIYSFKGKEKEKDCALL